MDQRTPTRTARSFVPHEGTFAQLYSRIVEQQVRCWLDMGEQYQSIRSMGWHLDHGDTNIAFYIRVSDNKLGRFINAPDDRVTWYEEQT